MDFIHLNNDLIFVRYRSQFNTEVTKRTQANPMLSDNTSFITSSIGIAAATAAYARIHMNELLINNQDHVYYTDTDSLNLDKPQPKSLVGSKIGLMKLEHADITLGLFASPKMYYLELIGGTEVKAKSLTNPSLNAEDLCCNYIMKLITMKLLCYNDCKVKVITNDNDIRLSVVNQIKSLSNNSVTITKYTKLYFTLNGNGNVEYIISVMPITSRSKTYKGYVYNYNTFNENSNWVFSFTDENIGLNLVKRTIANVYFIIDNKNHLILESNTKMNFSFIQPTKPHKSLNDNFLTFDIETYVGSNGTMTPYYIGFYDGKLDIVKCYNILTYNNDPRRMIIECFNDMLNLYNKHIVYIHNFSGFDSNFLFVFLSQHFKVNFKFKDSKHYYMKIMLDDKYVILQESYLLLSFSLKELCLTFKVDKMKSVFPHSFLSEDTICR